MNGTIEAEARSSDAVSCGVGWRQEWMKASKYKYIHVYIFIYMCMYTCVYFDYLLFINYT